MRKSNQIKSNDKIIISIKIKNQCTCLLVYHCITQSASQSINRNISNPQKVPTKTETLVTQKRTENIYVFLSGNKVTNCRTIIGGLSVLAYGTIINFIDLHAYCVLGGMRERPANFLFYYFCRLPKFYNGYKVALRLY